MQLRMKCTTKQILTKTFVALNLRKLRLKLLIDIYKGRFSRHYGGMIFDAKIGKVGIIFRRASISIMRLTSCQIRRIKFIKNAVIMIFYQSK